MFMDQEIIEHGVWVESLLVWTNQYRIHSQYLPTDGAAKPERVYRLPKNSVLFYQTCCPDKPFEFTQHYIFALHVLRSIAFTEELYLYYGSSYSFRHGYRKSSQVVILMMLTCYLWTKAVVYTLWAVVLKMDWEPLDWQMEKRVQIICVASTKRKW